MSTSHAAWDVEAVPGVHAMHSVNDLGTARGANPDAGVDLLVFAVLVGDVRLEAL